MKSVFSEYYKIDKNEEKRIWKDGLIVVDNNILLNQYRYSKATSDKVIEVLTKLKDRLWIPYQVGLEYHNSRLDCFCDNWNASKKLKNKVDELKKRLLDEAHNNFNRTPFIVIDEFDKVVNKSFKQIEKKLDEWDNPDVDFVNDDPINKKIIDLFDGRVGEDLSNEELEKLFKEGEKRYKEKVPPGYKDDTPEKQAKGKRNVYGDLIIWKQIIAKAKEEKKDVVFISDDEKEDWWFEWKGRKLYPRVELIREFRKETGQKILLYNQRSFLEYANTNLEHGQLDDTIKEVDDDIKKKEEIKERLLRDSMTVDELWREMVERYTKAQLDSELVAPDVKASFVPTINSLHPNNNQYFISHSAPTVKYTVDRVTPFQEGLASTYIDSIKTRLSSGLDQEGKKDE